uniref:ABC transporter domain-containing protein n=1 Tax=Strongyloides stercoralis TaxID=6248 RepID=A0A0K0EIP7_STRER
MTKKISKLFFWRRIQNYMRYGSRVDWLLLCLGITFAVISGLIQPFECLLTAYYYEIFAKGYKDYRDDKMNYNPQKIQDDSFKLIYRQIILVIGILITISLSTIFFYLLTERQIKILKIHYIKSVLKQDMNWFEENPPGKISSSISSTFEKIRFGLNPKLSILLCTISFTISSLIISLSYSTKLGLTLIGGVAGAVLPLIIGIILYNRWSDKEYDSNNEIGSIIEEIFSGIRTVMSFNGQSDEINRYTSMVNKIIIISKKKVIILTITYAIFTFIVNCEFSLTLLVGYNLVKNGIITYGTIMAVIGCIFGSIVRLDELVYQVGKLVEAIGHIESVLNIIDRIPDVDYLKNDGIIIDKFEGKIVFNNVSFNYQSRPQKLAVNCINFTINPGESCALVGYSGGGKSTILNLLMRYYNLKSGEIFIDNISHNDINLKWLRENISIVFQEPILFTGTIKENILIGKPDATDEEISEACKIAYAEHFINGLPNKYNTFIGEGGIKMSGGMKQRICIARAIIRNPKILILDEATSALDATSERKVLKALMNASKGRTTLAISHKIHSIKSYNKILVFDQGEIVESGRHNDLIMKKGLYYKLAMCENLNSKKVKKSKKSKKLLDSQDENLTSRNSSVNSTSTYCSTNIPSIKSTTTKNSTSFSTEISQEYNTKKSFITSKTEYSGEIQTTDKFKKKSKVKNHKMSILNILIFSLTEKKKIFIGLFFIFINGLQLPSSVFTTAYVMDIFTKPLEDVNTKNQYINGIIIFVLLALTFAISYCASGHLFGFAGINISKKMRIQAYKNILYQTLPFFENKKNDPGRLTGVLTTDALNINQGIDLTFVDALSGIISSIISAGIALYFNLIVGSSGLGIIIFFFGLSGLLTFINNKINDKSNLISKRIVSMELESINNVKTIQAFTRIEEMVKKYTTFLDQSYDYYVYSGILTSIGFSIGYSIFGISTIISLIIGTNLLINNDINPYYIIQCIDAISYVCYSLFYVYPYISDYIPFRKGISNLYKYINKKPQFLTLNGNRRPIIGDIEMKNGYFSYPHVPNHLILKDLNFKVNFGESLALVGHSGCGKSTILQLLERHYCLLDGAIEIDGINIKEFNLHHYRNNVSIVSQEPTIFNLTIRENICYGLNNVLEDRLEEVLKDSNIYEFIQSLPNGLDTSCGPKGKQLSGGQKQRIAIARSLIRNPKILLLDEATSALDTKSEYLVQDALEKAFKNRTTIIVAHKLSTITNCNCIAVVNNGIIVEKGTHEELIKKQGEYYKLINCNLTED